MKGYQIKNAAGACDVDESDIHELFKAEKISRDTPCRERNSPIWKTVNEHFPLLKYGVSYEPTQAGAKESKKPAFPPLRSGAAILSSIAVLIAAVSLILHFFDRPDQANGSGLRATEIAVLEKRLQPNPQPTPNRIDVRPPSPARQIPTVRSNPPHRPPATVRRSTLRPQVATTQPPPVETETLAQRRRGNEFQIAKNRWVDVSGYHPGAGRIMIVEDTPISVTVAYGARSNKYRYEKHKSFEGNNYTPLANGLIYVDTARSSPGKVTLTTDR